MPKRVTTGGVYLRDLSVAPGLRSSEETSQRWRAVGDTVLIWLARASNLKPTTPIACALRA